MSCNKTICLFLMFVTLVYGVSLKASVLQEEQQYTLSPGCAETAKDTLSACMENNLYAMVVGLCDYTYAMQQCFTSCNYDCQTFKQLATSSDFDMLDSKCIRAC